MDSPFFTGPDYPVAEKEQDGFLFSTDKQRISLAFVHHFLSVESYWARKISLQDVKRSIDHSVCIGIYHAGKQVGFARVVTDFCTFGYLADVFVDVDYRGKGLSKKMMAFIISLECMARLRRIMLGTADAHGLYRQFGFAPTKYPERFMEIHRPDIYSNNPE